MNEINIEEFETQTVAALYRSLSFSKDLLDRYDPENNDMGNREEAIAYLDHLRKAIKLAHADWIAEVN